MRFAVAVARVCLAWTWREASPLSRWEVSTTTQAYAQRDTSSSSLVLRGTRFTTAYPKSRALPHPFDSSPKFGPEHHADVRPGTGVVEPLAWLVLLQRAAFGFTQW
jgi:hypothetical protein